MFAVLTKLRGRRFKVSAAHWLMFVENYNKPRMFDTLYLIVDILKASSETSHLTLSKKCSFAAKLFFAGTCLGRLPETCQTQARINSYPKTDDIRLKAISTKYETRPNYLGKTNGQHIKSTNKIA